MKFSVSVKILVLFVAFFLLTSVGIGTVFADKEDDKKKKTFEQMCAKKKGNEPDALFCQAILGLQHTTDSFFDIFTDLRLADTNLQNQIDSFFDVFTDISDLYNVDSFFDVFTEIRTTDTNLQSQIDSFENQDCDDGYYVSGIDDDGKIKCKPLPSAPFCGDSIVTLPETCDDGNTVNGDGCSDTCSIETAQVCGDGIVTSPETCDDGNFINGDGCSVTCLAEPSLICGDGIVGPLEQCDGADLGGQTCSSQGFSGGSLSCTASCAFDTSSCAAPVCGDGITTGAEECDDGNAVNGDGCSATCSTESCDTDTNPVCSLAFPIPSVSGDMGSDVRAISDNGEKWYNITIREESVFAEAPEAIISLDSGSNNYDLYVYCETCGGAQIGSSTLPTGFLDFVSVQSANDLPLGDDDTFRVLIEVRASSVDSCSDYTLTVYGNVVSEYGDLGLC